MVGGDRNVAEVKTAKLLQEAPTALVFVLCLFGGGFVFATFGIVASVFQKIEAAFYDEKTQWIVVLCIGTYVVAFTTMRNRRFRDWIAPTGGVDLWRTNFLVISTLVYFFNYRHAAQSTQMVVLLGGAALGSGAWVNLFWRSETGSNQRSLWRFIALAVVMLAITCFWKSGVGSKFSYKDNARWVGPWGNPNLYGLLMASVVTLALGLGLTETGRAGTRGSRRQFWNRLKEAVFLGAAVAISFGLWKSYSRGAWLASGIGGMYLLIQWCKRTPHHWPLSTRHWSVTLAVCALLALLFWQNQYPESVTAHRAISASNRSDLSWRNRVSAWEGALQIMAERPWQGSGWNQPEAYYGHYYSASRLDETIAIQLNDYLTLGTTVGIPALFCFGMYLWLSLSVSSKFEIQDTAIQELDWLKAVCRAGALVLAVGFWFDGGLFKLPTAATFWILLELGRVD
jgi:hypothetical protein